MWMMPLHLHVNQKSEYDMMMIFSNGSEIVQLNSEIFSYDSDIFSHDSVIFRHNSVRIQEFSA